MANTIADLAVRIGADTAELRKGLAQGETSLEKFGRAGVNMAKTFAVAIVAAVTAVTALAAKGIALGDSMQTSARQLGMTVTELGGLHHAARLANVETATLEGGMVKLAVSVSRAAQGSKAQADALTDLHLSAKELQRLPLTEQMLRVGDAMSGVKAQTEQLRIATELFGRGAGRDFVGMFQQGTTAMREQFEEAKRYGLYMDNTQTRVVAEAADSQDKLKTAFDGLALQLGATLAPAFELVTGWLTKLTGYVTQAIPKLAAFAETYLGIARAAADMSDNDVQETLLQHIRLMDDLNNRIAEQKKLVADNPGNPTMQATLNDYLGQQIEKQARINELLAERVKRSKEPEKPAVPVLDDDDTDSAAAERRRAIAAHKALFEGLEEIDAAHYATRIEAMRNMNDVMAAEQRAADEQALNAHSMMSDAMIENVRRRTEYEKMSTRDKATHVIGTLADMTAGVAQHSKKMFALNKALSIASAVVNTAQGVTKALASYPPPISFVMAAAQAAAGAAQIAAIKGTQFEGGGGGTTPSAAGTTPTVNSQPVAAASSEPSRVIRIEGVGDRFTRTQVRELIEQLNEAKGDGARFVFA